MKRLLENISYQKNNLSFGVKFVDKISQKNTFNQKTNSAIIVYRARYYNPCLATDNLKTIIFVSYIYKTLPLLRIRRVKGNRGYQTCGQLSINNFSGNEKLETQAARPNKECAAKPEYPAEFESFWAIYPRKVEKKAAYNKFKAATRKGYTSEQLIGAATNYSAACKENETDVRYMKHPATFLGPSEPFTDYLEAAIPEPTIEIISNKKNSVSLENNFTSRKDLEAERRSIMLERARAEAWKRLEEARAAGGNEEYEEY